MGADAWSADSVAAELTAPWRHVVVAEDAAVPGWAVLVGFDPADVLRVAVDPAARRRGIGRALLAELLSYAGERTMLLEVFADNVAAQALYAGAGLVAVDRRRGYYPDGRDAVVMSRATGESHDRR